MVLSFSDNELRKAFSPDKGDNVCEISFVVSFDGYWELLPAAVPTISPTALWRRPPFNSGVASATMRNKNNDHVVPCSMQLSSAGTQPSTLDFVVCGSPEKSTSANGVS